jgi:hypothetical protein
MTETHLVEKFGRCTAALENSREYLTIYFSPSASARKERWRNYGLSADFLGDYFANFFPGNNLPEHQPNKRTLVRSAISFVANELLENAIKHNADKVCEPISISLYLHSDHIVFHSVNYTDQAIAWQFKSFIHKLLATDNVQDLLLQQLEQNAIDPGHSGLGFLTMICDYGIEFGWIFQPVRQYSDIIQVEVLAYLSLLSL